MPLEFFLVGGAIGAVVKARRAGRFPSLSGLARRRPWELPPLHLLDTPRRALESDLGAYPADLVAGLAARGVTVRHTGTVIGPTVARIELDLGAERFARLTALRPDIGYLLGTPNPRILPTVDGRSVVGIEIPRRERELVRLSTVLGAEPVRVLDIGIGLTVDGAPVVANFEHLPHLLIAGATGAGKSTFLNSLIVSLLLGATPRDLQLLLIDPKRVELSQYEGLPHLWRPIVTEGGDAIGALLSVVEEMENRYKQLKRLGVRKLSEAHEKGVDIPYLVVIIDEVAELMMTARDYVEPPIARIAQLGRAAGIHLGVATQRPDVKVITGGIKANVPSRVGFAVASHTDSRVILDNVGAEHLLGRGDLLYTDGGPSLTRAQSAYVTNEEIRKVVSWWIDQR